MKTTAHLKALPALLAFSGCVAILGVDSDEYEDIDEAVCGCRGPDLPKSTCEGIIQDVIQFVPGFERLATSCVASSRSCRQLSNCIREAGACLAPADPCTPVDENTTTIQFRCCTGECTDSGTCPTGEDVCTDLKQPCGGDADPCCDGLECGSDELCCRSLGGSCNPDDGSSPCCPGQVICDASICKECANTGQTCNDQIPCCDAQKSCVAADVGFVCL
jgi:hypothetical protein